MTTFLLSAYPALSAPGPVGREEQREIYARLRGLDDVGLVELPLDAGGGVPDEEFVLSQLRPDWDVLLTTVPGTLQRVGEDPGFGLASDDPEGGDQAVEHLAACLATARRIQRATGRSSVAGIAVVSCPSLPPGRRDGAGERFLNRLSSALETAGSDIPLLVEHCDAYVAGQPAAKGFLDIEDEIRVVSRLRRDGHARTGLVVNWGRSAIETRSVGGPVVHLERARAAGVLSAVVLSGCSDQDGAFGPAWSDAHLPTSDLPAPAGEPTSLLSPAEARLALEAAGPGCVVGTKFAVRPHDLDPPARAAAIADGFGHVVGLARLGAPALGARDRGRS